MTSSLNRIVDVPRIHAAGLSLCLCVARIDGAHTAISCETEAGRWNLAIGPNDELAALTGPFLTRMEFAAGGSVIGLSGTGYFRLVGLDAEFVVASENEYRATMILAADAASMNSCDARRSAPYSRTVVMNLAQS
ncbi:MAG: hypothetical protein M5R36_07665 [Deltaproteobacteria bacterium]|nr:hypothetical protein [Deltaproteobacteria bacterium]